MPWASINDAPEWRSSCRCQWPRPARRQIRENQCDTLSGSSGVPKALGAHLLDLAAETGMHPLRHMLTAARERDLATAGDLVAVLLLAPPRAHA